MTFLSQASMAAVCDCWSFWKCLCWLSTVFLFCFEAQ